MKSNGLGICKRIRQATAFDGLFPSGRLNSVHSRCSAAETRCSWLLNPSNPGQDLSRARSARRFPI